MMLSTVLRGRGSIFATASLLLLASFATCADESSFTIIFYLNSSSRPVSRLDRLAPLTDPIRAVLAMYASQAAAGCAPGEGTVGVECELTRALGLGSQCSSQHVGLVTKWFKGPIPDTGWSSDSPQLENTKPRGDIAAFCYTPAKGQGLERAWERIRLKTRGSQIIVDATGVQLQPPNGEQTRQRRFVTYTVDHEQIRAVSSVPYEYMLAQTDSTVASSDGSSQQASQSTIPQTPPRYEGPAQDTLVIPGSYPSDYLALPDGRAAFTAYAEDGNHRALRILDGLHVIRTAMLDTDSRLVGLNDSFIVAATGCEFQVIDAKTNILINHKRFSAFCPGGAGSAWLEGSTLTVIAGASSQESTLRRIRLPEMEVSESFSASFVGTYVRWGEKFVGVGQWTPDKQRPSASAFAVFDRNFTMLDHTEIDRSQPRNNGSCELSAPAVYDNLFVYAADCGGLRVYDLTRMRLVGARGPIDTPYFLEFSSWNGGLLASGPELNGNGFVINWVSIPSMETKRIARLENVHVIGAGPRFYLIEEGKEPRAHDRTLRISIHNLSQDPR
jgi:hypothetical protein